MKIIIFSKDRACQLDLLLRSIQKNWDFENIDISILYTSSNDKYNISYNTLFDKYNDIDFIKEDNFYNQLCNMVKYSQSEVIGIFTDDCIMFRKPEISCIQLQNIFTNNILFFSLRLGQNTIVQDYVKQTLQTPLHYNGFDQINENVICWNRNLHTKYSNYNYMFSLDGTFYHKNWLIDAFVGKTFEIPRALEYQMVIDKELERKSSNKVMSLNKSCVIVNSINAVQSHGIPCGFKYSYSPEELNTKFLEGFQISLDTFQDIEVNSTHGEIEIRYESIYA